MDEDERVRLIKLMQFESLARQQGYKIIAGIDEAGRGPLAGPVVAAACILPEGMMVEGVNDSKKLLPAKRRRLYETLVSTKEILYGVGIVDVEWIDKINIYQATIQAMLEAISKLSLKPDFLLVDGMSLPQANIPTQKIIKGDSLSQSIAAASIIAKEVRDALMQEYDALWPEYGFKQHKGYGTEMHLAALTRNGPSPIHRRSFEPVKNVERLPC